MELKSAKILVTGGSSGIGKKTAEKLSKRGAKVIVTARNKERLEKSADQINAIPVVADVSKKEDREKTFKAVEEQLGGLDVLINNAGIGAHFEINKLDIDKMEEVYRVNVFGAAMMGKKAAEIFKEQQAGNIINIGSTAGVKGYPGGSIYAGSKFALRGMTKCWQMELRKFNVRVFQVNPSEVQTNFGRRAEVNKEELNPKKLRAEEIAHTIESLLTMDDRGFIPETEVWATNPW